jgi:hypothetical protein
MTPKAFKTFASLHPIIEAYDSDPEKFCEFMRKEGYGLTNEQVKRLIDSCRETK